jgi:2-polyprenyl-3-methyl-5-hydroxy-6-metoxy-1,4-benzoquinol methylase
VRGAPRRAYDKWHESLDAEGSDADVAPWHLAGIPHLPDLVGRSVLEIGCGRGSFARWLTGKGARTITLADFSSTAVGIARANVARSATEAAFLVADVQRLPFDDATFDLVCSFETLEHVPAPTVGLGELVRVIRPGGRLIVTTPNYLGLLGAYRLYRAVTGRPYTEMGQPINQPLTLIGRVRRLRALGCRLDVIDGFGHYLYIPGRPPKRMRWLDGMRPITRWFGAHSLTVATKL